MPVIETKGAASAQGFGEFAKTTAAVYIEDVFSTWLTTGAGSAITVVNGIDLAGKGGLVWNKTRNTTGSNTLFDTARGVNNGLISDSTSAQLTYSNWLPAFNSDGFTIGTTNNLTTSSTTGVSWTFRKAPKFFDVVTWTGDGNSSSRIISHSLGATPGFLIIKCTSTSTNWNAFCRVNSTTLAWMYLNTTQAASSVGGTPSYTTLGITSTGIDVAKIWLNSPAYPGAAGGNASGETYVAYLFAHDAGGFGLTGTDNVISCGSYTGNGSANGPTITLGYEPQWVMIKAAGPTVTNGSWLIQDNMRGMTADGADQYLLPNSSAAEGSITGIAPTATGFAVKAASGAPIDAGANYNYSGDTYIYIAIRRGPMKTPTSGTSVFSPVSQTGGGTVTTNFVVDGVISKQANNALAKPTWFDRLRGSSATSSAQIFSSNTDAETDPGVGLNLANNTGYVDSAFGAVAGRIYWNFRRAPGFFDVVCYTGTGANNTQAHNLGVVPELMIVKPRNTADSWMVYAAPLGSSGYLQLESTGAAGSLSTLWNGAPTASIFNLGSRNETNGSGRTFVNYLFASCPGVSKVGSYTGNGTSQTINCGFTGGARFVMVKRTDSTGNWMVVDTARGLVSASDPTLYLNSTAAEVTGVDWLDPDNSGFIVNQESTMNANVNAATYIYLSIA